MDEPLLQRHASKNGIANFKGVANQALLLTLEIGNGSISYLSESVLPLFGYQKSEILLNGLEFISSLVHPNDCISLRRLYSKLVNQESGFPLSWSQEFKVKHANGYWLWVQGDFITEGAPGLNLNEIYIHIRDVSERKNQENWLWNQALKHNGQKKEDQNSLPIVQKFQAMNKARTDLNISPRELEVLQLISSGLSARQIAAKLFISVHTVISHRKSLIEKFGVKNTAELVKDASNLLWLE